MTRRLILILAAVTVLAAACSSSDDTSGTASQLATLDDAGGATGSNALAATTTTVPEEEITFEEAQLDFARCMRETHPEWPDPDPDAQGGRVGFSPEALQELGLDLQDGSFRTVVRDCQAESFANVAGQGDELSPEEQAEREDDLLALFACVRETPGYEDLPDPDFSDSGAGFGLRALFEDGGIDPQEFRTIMRDCQASLGIEGGRGAGGGTPGPGRNG